MSCKPSNVPKIDEIDTEAMLVKYAAEKERRMRKSGETAYVPPHGGPVEDYTVDPHMPLVPREPIARDIDVIVLGAGFGGVLASYYLMKAGVTDFLNLDTAGDFGGVWYWNNYPGIQCDNESYCYLPLLEETGFMPSKRFADGSEIQGYIRQIAEHFGFADKGLFHTQVSSLLWDNDLGRWQVKTNRGDEFMARHVVMANGVLNMPKLPSIEGMDKFKGKLFHSARWDYDYSGGTLDNPTMDRLKDKKVAIVGTGATAIQIVPHLAKYAQHTYVLQRTPSCVDARPNPATDQEWAKTLEPGWQAERMANFQQGVMGMFLPGDVDLICDFWTEINRNIQAEMEENGLTELSIEEFMSRRDDMDHRVMERMRRRVDELVDDPDTAERLKPYYRFMCKRPLSSETFYPAFNKGNVELIDVSETKGLQKLTENGFIANGKEYEADCIIFASGFEVTSDLERRWGIDRIEGRDGRSLYDHWNDGPLTLHGTMTHGFPNQYYVGYIQGGINASVTEHFGRQGEHIAYVIAESLKRGAESVEVNKQAMDNYVEHFEATTIDQSEFLNACPPSYFNNEGSTDHKWGLFRPWGAGWDDFLRVLKEWRDAGDLKGMDIRLSDNQD